MSTAEHNRSRNPGTIDAAAVGRYIPTNFANCELWLDANQIAGSDGDLLAAWNDLSGNSRNFAQATEARKPTLETNEINGFPVVRFVDDYLQNTGMLISPTTTQMFVVKPTGTSPVGIWDTGPNQGNIFRNYNTGNFEWHSGTPNAALGLANTNPVLLVFATSLDPYRKIIYYKNGTLISTNTTTALTYMTWLNPSLGAVNLNIYYVGDIAEVIIYSRVLTTTERTIATDFLKAKYAIA